TLSGSPNFPCSIFIARLENLSFMHAQVTFNPKELGIKLDQADPSHGDLAPSTPHFSLCARFGWSDNHVVLVSHLLSQLFAVFSNVGHLFIRVSNDHQIWQDNIDSTELLAFLPL